MHRPRPGRSSPFLIVALFLVFAWILFGPQLVKAVRGEEVAPTAEVVFVSSDADYAALMTRTEPLANIAISAEYFAGLPDMERGELSVIVRFMLIEPLHPVMLYGTSDISAVAVEFFELVGYSINFDGCMPMGMVGFATSGDQIARVCHHTDAVGATDEAVRQFVRDDYAGFLSQFSVGGEEERI